MKICSIKYYLYDTIGYGVMGRQMIPYLQQYLPKGDSHGNELLGELERCIEALIDVYGDDTRKNPFTQKSKVADRNRDNTIRRLKKVLDGARHHYQESVAEAAAQLYRILENHQFGRTKRSYEVQTATMEALLCDFATEEMKQCIRLVGVQEAVKLLRKQQDLFEEMGQKKRDFKSMKKGSAARRLTLPIRLNCIDLVHHLNSRQRLHPADYEKLTKLINKVISDRNSVAKTRRTRKQNRKKKELETGGAIGK